MIEELKNPFTPDYFNIKNSVLSADFPWYFMETTVESESNEYAASPYFSHAVIKPPYNPNLFPTISSPYSDICNSFICDVCKSNNLQINSIIRINFNLTLPLSTKPSQPHYDHDFPHKNLLVYLNNSDGDTTVIVDDGELKFSPKEDSVILFEGLHYQYFPSENRRVIMITTFI